MRNLQLLPQDEPPAKAQLVHPGGSGYVLLAAEVDAHPPFLWPSRTKRLRDFVLAHFDANDTAPLPILYRFAT